MPGHAVLMASPAALSLLHAWRPLVAALSAVNSSSSMQAVTGDMNRWRVNGLMPAVHGAPLTALSYQVLLDMSHHKVRVTDYTLCNGTNTLSCNSSSSSGSSWASSSSSSPCIQADIMVQPSRMVA